MAEVTSGDVTVIVLDNKEVEHLQRVLVDWEQDVNTWLPLQTYGNAEGVKESCMDTFDALYDLAQALGVSFAYEGE